jgi:glycosyltransferase involved in cell wall biosynthesis
MMKFSVLIPSYNRPEQLERCLAGLDGQTRRADQIVLVLRCGDEGSVDVAERWSGRLPIQVQTIDRPGVVQALNLGLDYAEGEIVTITDDDTEALPDWLARIEAHFQAEDRVGGVGGRDLLHQDGIILPATARLVGRIMPFGRIVGNHHLGVGPARYVEHLKGVNMSWRRAAIAGERFDTELRGDGAQVYFELAFSLGVLARGWRLLYDPAIQVHHYVAPRFDADQRRLYSQPATENAAYNLYLSLFRYMPRGPLRWSALSWARWVGTATHPGILRGLGAWLRRDPERVELRVSTARAWCEARAAARLHSQGRRA